MPIRLSCPTCNKALAVPDDKAGLRVACPGCKNHLRVPANGQAAHHDGTAAKSRPAAAVATASEPMTSRRTSTPHLLSEWGQVDAALGEAVEVLDRGLSKHEEAQARASLTAYADAVPHHNLRGLGKQVTITRVRELRSYRVVLDSLFEKRHFTRKEEPFQGGDVPAATVTDANIRVWGYPFPTATEFRNDTKENAVEESMGVRPCQKCGGQKAVACAGCSSSGAVACSACRGDGDVKCGQCGGHGTIKVRTGTQQRWLKCGRCGGTGQSLDKNCPVCAARGLVPEDEDVFQLAPCPSCHRGAVRCPTCGGHGQVRCPKCSGSGKLPCTPCKATGQMLSYLAIMHTFTPTSETITVPCPGIKDKSLAGMLQESDYAPLFNLATTNIPTALKLTSGAEKVRAGIIKAFDAGLGRVSDDNRLIRHRLQVGVASVLEVSYQHQGEAYMAWFVGKQLKVQAPVNPVTDALKQKVKDAVGTWKKGDQKEAVLVLNEVTDMAKADPYCHAAYEEVRQTIPTDLESKVRWQRLKPVLIVGGIAGGVVVLVVMLLIGFALLRSMYRNGSPPPFGGIERPGGQPAFQGEPGAKEGSVLVLFRDRNMAVAKGGKVTLRLTVQRVGNVEGDVTLKLEAAKGLTVPAQVVVEQARQEVEIEVVAGDEAGVFTVRASPVGVNGPPFPAEARVTVGGPGGVPLPLRR